MPQVSFITVKLLINSKFIRMAIVLVWRPVFCISSKLKWVSVVMAGSFNLPGSNQSTTDECAPLEHRHITRSRTKSCAFREVLLTCQV